MGKYISTHTGPEIDAAVDAVAEVAEKVENQTQETIDEGLRPYKVYAGLISQSGMNAPAVTILENTIGDIVVSRSDFNLYYFTLAGAFPSAKTLCFALPSQTSGSTIKQIFMRRISNDVVEIRCWRMRNDLNPINIYSVSTDGQLSNDSFEIRVYP